MCRYICAAGGADAPPQDRQADMQADCGIPTVADRSTKDRHGQTEQAPKRFSYAQKKAFARYDN